MCRHNNYIISILAKEFNWNNFVQTENANLADSEGQELEEEDVAGEVKEEEFKIQVQAEDDEEEDKQTTVSAVFRWYFGSSVLRPPVVPTKLVSVLGVV